MIMKNLSLRMDGKKYKFGAFSLLAEICRVVHHVGV